ncbi:MAG: metal-sensing transcriptional repressor [Lachnospiraceae bacterium]|nr:metal-sensing transcriptional repressor [Lachnospiraceae bacterium]
MTGEENTAVCPACSGRIKERSEKEYKDLMNRLKRIEGQVRGLQKMLEENAYCPDILVQVSAVNSALSSFGKVLLAEHFRSCVTEDIRNGHEEAVDEMVALLQKLMR